METNDGSQNTLLLELNMPGQSHSMVNGALVNAAIKSTLGKVHFVCMQNHIECLHLEKVTTNLTHIPFETITFKDSISKIKSQLARSFKTFITLRKYIKRTNAHRSNIMFLSVNQYELISIYFLNILFPKAKFSAVIHGNLNYIQLKVGRNPYNRFFSYYYAIKRLKAKNFKLIVLEDWIKEHLNRDYPELCDNVQVQPHPIDMVVPSNRDFNINNIELGIAGILSPSKNIESVNKLQSLLGQNLMLNKTVSIKHLMYLPKEFEAHAPMNLPFKLQSNWLQNDDIKKFYTEVDFIIWFHGVDKFYKYSASGILLDAVKFKKPLIALSCTALVSIEKKYGKISVSGNSVEEIISILQSFTKHDYQVLINNLSELQQQRLLVQVI